MNIAVVGALLSLATLLTTVLAAFFTYGRLAERVSGHSEKLTEHAATLTKHGERISENERALERLNGWKEGFAVASGMNGKEAGS